MKQKKVFKILSMGSSSLLMPMNFCAFQKQGLLAEEEANTYDYVYHMADINNFPNLLDSPISKLAKGVDYVLYQSEPIDNYYGRVKYMSLMDYKIRISGSMWDMLVQYHPHSSDTIFAHEIPRNFVPSIINDGVYVEHDNISEIYGDMDLLPYHYSRFPKVISDKFTEWMDKKLNAVNFGFEAEKVDSDFQYCDNVMKLAHETGFKKMSDSSLNSGGYELISPVLPLYADSVIDSAIHKVSDLLNANVDDSCGGHINVSINGMKAKDILKKIKGVAPLFYALYQRRMNNRYCQVKNFATYLRSPNKYTSFYIKNDDILEIRLFSAIKNESILKNRIQLLRFAFGEFFGKSANDVLIDICNERLAVHQFLMSKIFGNDRQKFIKRVKDFAIFSDKYGCGKISDSTKKKVNALMGENIFIDVVPVDEMVQEVRNEIDAEAIQSVNQIIEQEAEQQSGIISIQNEINAFNSAERIPHSHGLIDTFMPSSSDLSRSLLLTRAQILFNRSQTFEHNMSQSITAVLGNFTPYGNITTNRTSEQILNSFQSFEFRTSNEYGDVYFRNDVKQFVILSYMFKYLADYYNTSQYMQGYYMSENGQKMYFRCIYVNGAVKCNFAREGEGFMFNFSITDSRIEYNYSPNTYEG